MGLCLILCLVASAKAAPPVLRLDPHGHTAAVSGLMFGEDGKHLLSVGEDGAVRVWNLNTKQIEQTWRYPSDAANRRTYKHAVLSAASPARLAIGESSDGERGTPVDVLIIDPSNGRLIQRIVNQHKTAVTCLEFRADGKQLAVCDAEGRVCVYDLDADDHWKCQQVAAASAGSFCYGLAYSPDGTRLATGIYSQADLGGEVQIWDSRTRKQIKQKRLSKSFLYSLAWSKQNEVAGCDFDLLSKTSKVILWNPDGQADPIELQGQKTGITCLTFSPDGQKLLTAQDGANDVPGFVQMWDGLTGERAGASFQKHHLPIMSVAVSPTKNAGGSYRIASGDYAGGIYVWDSQTRQEEWNPGARQAIYRVAWSADGGRLAWNLRDDSEDAFDHAFDLRRAVPIAVKDVAGAIAKTPDAVNERSLHITSDRDGVDLRIQGRVVNTIKLDKGDLCYAKVLTPDNQAIVACRLHVARYDVTAMEDKNTKAARNRLYVGAQGVILGMAVSPDGNYLAGASSAQTVLIWSLRDPGEGAAHEVRPLLTIYTGGSGEWVAWNEQTGYYAASATGDDLLTWQVNHEQDALAEIRTAWQCRKQFYQPELIRSLIKAGSIQKAIEEVGLKQASMQEEISRAPSLQLADYREAGENAPLTPAHEGIAVKSPYIELRVKSDDPSPNVDIELQVNRRLQSSSRRGIVEQPGSKRLELDAKRLIRPPYKDSSGYWIIPVELTSGDNDIVITARNGAGEGTLPLAVRYVTANPQNAKRTLHVLAVGVNSYPNLPREAKLLFPVDDAKAITAAFQDHYKGLYDAIDAHVLPDAEATKDKILAAIADLKAANPQDTVILFLSGHGVADVDNKQFDFAPVNARENAAGTSYENMISWNDIINDISQLPAKNVLILVDHCYSGGAQEIEYANETLRAAREKNVLIYSSSKSDQVSYEDPDLKQGVFTFALLQVLTGKVPGALDDRKQLMLDKAEWFIKNEVQKAFDQFIKPRHPEASQEPNLWGPPNSNKGIPLVMFGV